MLDTKLWEIIPKMRTSIGNKRDTYIWCLVEHQETVTGKLDTK